jgi:chemotaxis protein MotB
MKMPLILCSLFSVGIALSSCVSSKKFKASESARTSCEEKARNLEATVNVLESDTTQYGIRYRSLQQEKDYLEQISASEKEHLTGELGAKENELAQKEKMLADREKRLQELEDVIARKDQAVNDLKNRVANALVGFKSDELSIEMKDGKVYVSLAEKLLFKSGSATVDPKGKEALGKLAEVLEKNPDIDIMIEGHTDNVPLIPGKFEDNWDLSASRALSIVRILTQDNKVDPKRVIAAGRGEYVPIADNSTPEGKARNRRTEIILSPKLDELFKLLQGQ